MIHSSVEPILPAIREAVLESYGDAVARIYLLGSATRPDDFRPGVSDIDVSIVFKAIPNEVWKGLSKIHIKVEELAPSELQISLKMISKIERWRSFELCYEGRVAEGVLLYDAGYTFDGERLGREEAKKEVVALYRSQAKRWLCVARRYVGTTDMRVAEWESCRAACRALQALLLLCDFDPAPKNIRWNLPALSSLVAARYAVPESVSFAAGLIPADIEGETRDDLDFVDAPAPDAALQNRLAIARAWFVISWCKRVRG